MPSLARTRWQLAHTVLRFDILQLSKSSST